MMPSYAYNRLLSLDSSVWLDTVAET